VDDNISLRKTITFILKRKGYNVNTDKDGLEAIARVKESSFDIIFMDIKMPLMNGVETYKRIKKIRPDAIVIMMTAYSVDELIQEAIKEGAYGVLYKPLDLEKVIKLINETLEKKEGGFILIVDDDLSFSSTLKNILTKREYVVGIANSGEEAVSMAQEKDYHVMLIDMKLPTINGLETYLAIKKVNPKVVAIMMTGYRQEMDDLVLEAIQNTAYTCLYKPLDMNNLLKLIEEILKRK
jgi:DNA-binding NtrC family response regulator